MKATLAVMLAGMALLAAACDRKDAVAPVRALRAAAAGPAALAKGVVDVEGGMIRLGAQRDGLIGSVSAREGDHVTAGQVLATIDDRQSRLAVDVAQADEEERRAQATSAQARLDTATREAARLDRLAKADAAPRQEAEQAAAAVRAAAGDQQQALRALASASARRKLDAFEIEARRIRAPVAGRLVRVAAAPGASTSATGGALFTIAPDRARIVRADLDEAFAGSVKVGMTATVVREFDERRTYPAKVIRIADVFGAPALADDPTARVDSRVLAVVLALDDTADLKLGERVLVSFNK